jgi:protein-S-isoprenylcysteine O-methyltransferase Ste14
MRLSIREILGYLLGGLLFVALLPTVMWLASGMPKLEHIGAIRAAATGLLMLSGLALSVWTIVYMKRWGKGNPMDAFGHEVAPRTQHLMTDGPYRINRNPMLTGTLIYLAGIGVWLWCWQAWLVWILFFTIMLVQVLSEERRLRRDFGEEYEDYCRSTCRFFPTLKRRLLSDNNLHKS